MPDTSNERRLGRRESLQTDMLLEDPSSERKPNYVSEEGPIIVYGDCLDAYACVYGLLHMGIPGIRIIMMHPSKKPDVCSRIIQCFVCIIWIRHQRNDVNEI